MSNKKNICLIIPSLQAGGMERVMCELAGYLCKNRNDEIHLVMYGINPHIFYAVPENLIIHKPDLLFNSRFRFISTVKRLFYLRKKIKSIRPDASLSFGERWNSFVILALYGLNFRLFVSDRCQPDKSLGWMHDFLRRRLYIKATGIIVQTEIAKSIYHTLYHHSNIKVIGNPIRKIERLKDQERENIVLSVGRLIESKHHDELIKVFAQINHPEWKLLIIGDDALKQKNKIKLQALIASLQMEQKIILTGACNNVDEYYKKSKIFAFTSSSEGFPNVIGEAQAAGLAVITFDCIAGPSDLIKDSYNGILIDLFDYASFEQKLQLLMNDADTRNKLSKYAINTVQEFSTEKIVEQFYNFLLS